MSDKGNSQKVEPQSDAEMAVRGFFSFAGNTFEQFVQHNRRWVTNDVLWIDHGNPDGIRGIDGLVAEYERVRKLGVAYLSFQILHLAIDKDVVFTQRLDSVLGEDGGVIATLDILGINKVRDGRICWGKDHYFNTASYTQAWYDNAAT